MRKIRAQPITDSPRGAAAIAQALASRIEPLCAVLLPKGIRRGFEWRVGSLHGEAGESLGVRLRGAKTGVWSDFATDEGGDALNLVAGVLKVPLSEAMSWARDWLYGAARDLPARPTPHVHRREHEDARTHEIARRIWREAQPIAGTLGERYLRDTRAIELKSWPRTLRFHQRLYHGPTRGTWPGIVCAVQDVDGNFVGVWRIFLDPKAGDKAPVANPRLALGPVREGAIRLCPMSDEIAIGEGVETSLAVIAGTGRACWSAMSASFLKSLRVPAQAGRIWLLEENDKPDRNGRRASPDAVRGLGERLLSEGREVLVVRPPVPFKDMNDLLLVQPHA